LGAFTVYGGRVASPDSTLAGLGQQLLGCADPALLDAPLDALNGRVSDDEVRGILETIYEAGEASCLRDLLSPGMLDRWASGIATPREEEALRAQLQRWLGVGQAGDDDPARLVLVQIAPLPTDLEGVLAWARPYELLGELTRPACEILPDGGAVPPDVSLLACCLGSFEARGKSLLAAQRAREEARAHLVREAAAHAAPGAREALWKRPLPDPALRALGERLRAVFAGTGLAALHSVGFLPASLVSVDVETGTARGQLRAGDGPIAVRLFLSGHEQRALHGECERCARPGCLHVRALAARLLDACHAQGDRLHAPLAEIARVPSWRRFLRAIKADEAPAEGRPERLGFRVRLDDGRAKVAVVLQKALPDGRWSAGKLVSPLRQLREPGCASRDRPVLEAMSLASRTFSAQPVAADLTLLRSLVEHPLVQLEGSPDALRVSEQSVQVALLEQPDGLLPQVSLAGAAVAPGARPREATSLLQHDRASGTLVFAALTPALRRLLAALAHFRGVLPPESYPLLAPWLASLEHVARVSAPKALRGTERAIPKKLLLRITPGLDEGIEIALSLRPLPLGALWPPGQGPQLAYGFEGGVQVFARRDLDWERAAANEAIEALGLHHHLRLEPFAYRIEGAQAALAVLSDAARLGELLELEWADRAPRLAIGSTVRSGDLKITISRKGQWFTLEGGARNAVADLAVGRLLEAARRGERFVAVQGIDHVEIERELFERLQLAQLCVNESVHEPAMSAAAAPFWLQKLGAETGSTDPSTREWLERAAGGARVEPAPLAPAWRARLRDYQQQGVSWLLERSGWAPGVCLADEMGLGKTVQAIALLEARATLGPALVVAPTSVIGNWLAELARFAPGLSASAFSGGDPGAPAPGSVLVASYELLLRHRARFDGLAFATQIVDEAQLVKNARTLRAKAVASIDAQFRVALSGTPVENSLGDLWSLFQLIAPGLLGSWARFRGRFAVPIERYENQERAGALRALVSPFVLRRTKSQVARELPSRTEVVHRIELSPAEQDLYDAAVREARRALGKRRPDEAGRSVQILAELTRLRQLACHPRLVLDDHRVESSKLNALIQLLDDILPRGHRVLLFSQFTRHLALVREAIEAKGASFLYLDGSTPSAQRTRLVERFQGGEGQVFLISLKAGGTGLNLTAADYVVHMDPWWNPAAEDQASDRAHRLGQERPLTIVKLVAQGTIEERVLGLHGQKRRLAEAVLAGTATPSSLDTAALEALLALG
jgi:superfamily II DNA or RNA helicase